MLAESVAMWKVREILRLKLGLGLSHKAIALSLGIAPSTVRLTFERTGAAGFSWPLPDDATDAILEERLYGRAGAKQATTRAEPDWAVIHRELKKKHVTLAILWEEYIAQNPEGCRYSRCDLYRSWEGSAVAHDASELAGGEKLFVDYAGDTVSVIVDRLSGETRPAQIFVAVMGGSSFTYANARSGLGSGSITEVIIA
jgi:transposase